MIGSNPGQQASLLGKLTDGQLQMELQNPSGAAPVYLVMAEMQKRAQMRQGGMNTGIQGPQSSVRQQMIQSAQRGGQAPMMGQEALTKNIAPAVQAALAQGGMQPTVPMPQVGGMTPPMAAAPNPMLPGGSRVPAFANGGMIQKFDDGGMPETGPGSYQGGFAGMSPPMMNHGMQNPQGAPGPMMGHWGMGRPPMPGPMGPGGGVTNNPTGGPPIPGQMPMMGRPPMRPPMGMASPMGTTMQPMTSPPQMGTMGSPGGPVGMTPSPMPHPMAGQMGAQGFVRGGLIQHFDNGGQPNSWIPDSLMPLIQNGQYTPQDLIAATQMASGEAGNQGPTGRQAVAAVALNRSRAVGAPLGTVIAAPGQFEGYNAGSQAMSPNSPQFQSTLNDIVPALLGKDPTHGATSFYSPASQAALGRDKPAWDDGSGAKIGGHLFFKTAANPTWATGSGSSSSASPSQLANQIMAIQQQAMAGTPRPDSFSTDVNNARSLLGADPSQAYAAQGGPQDIMRQQLAKMQGMSVPQMLMQAGAAMMNAKGTNLLGTLGAGLNAGNDAYSKAQANQREMQLALANSQVQQALAHSQFGMQQVATAKDMGTLQNQIYDTAMRGSDSLAGRTASALAQQADTNTRIAAERDIASGNNATQRAIWGQRTATTAADNAATNNSHMADAAFGALARANPSFAMLPPAQQSAQIQQYLTTMQGGQPGVVAPVNGANQQGARPPLSSFGG
jgi:hypothetical protein